MSSARFGITNSATASGPPLRSMVPTLTTFAVICASSARRGLHLRKDRQGEMLWRNRPGGFGGFHIDGNAVYQALSQFSWRRALFSTSEVYIPTRKQTIYNQSGCAFPLIDCSLGKSHEPTMFTDLFLRGLQGRDLFPSSSLSVFRPGFRRIAFLPER